MKINRCKECLRVHGDYHHRTCKLRSERFPTVELTNCDEKSPWDSNKPASEQRKRSENDP